MPEFPFTVIWAWERQNNIPLNYTQSSPTAIPKKEWCKTVIHATITSCQVHSHKASAFTETQNLSEREQNVFLRYLVPPLLSPCVCCLWRMLSGEGDGKITVKAMKMAQTRFADVWQQYKMKMAVNIPNVAWQRLSATDPSHQETYSLSAHAQALLILMGTSVQTERKSLIRTSWKEWAKISLKHGSQLEWLWDADM